MSQLPPVRPETAEVALIQELLNAPDLQHESKGHRTREVIRFLLELYKKDPSAVASETEIADAVYSGPGDEDDSLVRRAIARARRRVEIFCKQLGSGRSLRVEIPKGKYHLRFFHCFLRFGVPPIRWFWRRYLDLVEPISVGFATGSLGPFFSPECAARLYGLAASLVEQTSFNLPEILPGCWHSHGSWDGDGGGVEFGFQTIAFALPPFQDLLFDEVWKALPAHCTMRPFQDPLGKVVVSDPVAHGGSGMHVTSVFKRYVLLTRHKLSPNSEGQLTIISGPDGDAIERVFALLTSNETLFHVVISGELGGENVLYVDQAPDQFQVLFELRGDDSPELPKVVESRILLRPPEADDWGPG